MSSYCALSKTMQVMRAAWLAVAVVCLAFVLYILLSPGADAQTAAGWVLLLTMLILTFPAGIIAIGFIALYGLLVMPGRDMHSLDVVILWSAFVAVGYLQWFKLCPYLIEKWRKRKS
jgi:hypothetical protein